ncbi:MAG: SGNH/GDSL hydrolase family protein [Candidatus Omnitrophota bacterium]|jgi:hypothetical protein
MAQSPRKGLINGSVLIVSIISALLIGEALMRLVGMVTDVDYTLFAKELKNSDRLPKGLMNFNNNFWSLTPGAQVLATTSDFSVIYSINSRGLRDQEYSFEKPKGKKRVLALGDSFTFGEGVDYGKRFTDIPERILLNVEVINFGVPGYGLAQMLTKFTAEGLNYNPDVVILFINSAIIHRDDVDSMRDGKAALGVVAGHNPANSPATVYIGRENPFFKVKKQLFLLDKSCLFNFLHYKISLFLLKNRLRQQDKQIWGDILTKHIYVQAQHQATNNYESKVVTKGALIINKFHELCKERGITLIVVNINDTQIGKVFFEPYDTIKYYDLSEDLKNESKKYPLRFVYDMHYNQRTHGYIGKVITGILKRLLNESNC